MKTYLLFSLLLIMLVPYSTPNINYRNRSSACQEYEKTKERFTNAYKSLNGLNQESTEKLKKLLPIQQNYQNPRNNHIKSEIEKLFIYVDLMFYTSYPIYTKSPFKEYGLDFMNSPFYGEKYVHRNGYTTCYQKLVNSSHLIDELKRIKDESQRLVNGARNNMINFENGNLKSCQDRSLRPNIQTQLPEGIIFSEKAEKLISRQTELLSKVYDCAYDPIEESKKFFPQRDNAYNEFYTKMVTAMGPYFVERKKELYNFLAIHDLESYENLIKNSQNNKKLLNNLELSSMEGQKVEDTKILLQKVEKMFEKTRNYLSAELLLIVTRKIEELKNFVEALKNHDTNVEKYKGDIPNVEQNINELIRVTTETVNLIKQIRETGLGLITKIDNLKLEKNLKQHTLKGKNLDWKIEKFLKSTVQLFEEKLKFQNNKFLNLEKHVNAVVKISQFTKKQLLSENKLNLQNYERLKAETEKILEIDIPNYEKQLNDQTIKATFIMSDPSTILMNMEQAQVGLLKNLSSRETKLAVDLFSAIDAALEKATSTITDIAENNNNLKIIMSKNQDSFMKPDAAKSIDYFSNLIKVINGKIYESHPQINELKAKMKALQSQINFQKGRLTQINKDSDKISKDYTKIEESKRKILTQRDISPTEFEILIKKETQDLNFDLDKEVSKLQQHVKLYGDECSQIENSVSEFLVEIEQIGSVVEALVTKTDKLSKTHSNFTESISKGFELIKLPDLDSLDSIEKQLSIKFKSFKETITSHHNALTAEKQYNTNTREIANKKIKEISKIWEKIMVTELSEEYLVQNNLKNLSDFIQNYERLLTQTKNKVHNTEKEYNRSSKQLESDRQTLEQTKEAIKNLISSYQTYETECFNFSISASECKLDNNHSNLNVMFDNFKSTVDSINNQKKDLLKIKKTLAEEVSNELESTQAHSTDALKIKADVKSYLDKLDTLLITASTLKNLSEKLEEERVKLSSFKNVMDSTYKDNSDFLSNNEEKINSNGKTQINLLEKFKDEILKKYDDYEKNHQKIIETADSLKSDISISLKEKYNSLKLRKQSLMQEFDSQLKAVSGALAEATSHYKNEKNQLENDYSTQTSELDSLLKEINLLLKKISNFEKSHNINDINNEFTILMTKIKNFFGWDKNDHYVSTYKGEIKAIIPEEKEIIERDIQIATSEDNQYVQALTVNSKSPALETEPNNSRKIERNDELIEPKDNAENLHTNDVVDGDSRNIATKDYFKVIMTVTTVALIAMVIFGTVIAYRNYKKREIYKKCENIYVHA